MSDEELVKRLLDWSEHDEGKINDARQEAADRIEQLVASNEYLNSRLENVLAREAETYAEHKEQLEAARADSKEAEAYAEELEQERDEALNQLDSARHSVDVLEGRVAMLMARLDATKDKAEAAILDLMSKLGKAVEVLRALSCKCQSNCDWERDDVCTSWTARAVLAEIEGSEAVTLEGEKE